MRLIIDADATPNLKELCLLASKYKVVVKAFCDTSHQIELGDKEVIVVDKHAQSVDIVLVNYVEKGDIVITQDYGLALLCLGLGTIVINPNGTEYKDTEMNALLAFKHNNECLRKQGVHIKGPKKRTKDDTHKFLSLVEEVLQRM
ncbi:MAG: DUF188 domain-containing protein [Bacilli bacterium]